jgi:hypothetical protein
LDHVRLVEVDGLDVRVPGGDEAKRGGEPAADVHQGLDGLESAVHVQSGPHVDLRVASHGAVEQAIELGVLLPVLPGVHAVRAREGRDGVVEHGLVDVLPCVGHEGVLEREQQRQERVPVVHQEPRDGLQAVAPLRRLPLLAQDGHLAEDPLPRHHTQQTRQVRHVDRLPWHRQRRELGALSSASGPACASAWKTFRRANAATAAGMADIVISCAASCLTLAADTSAMTPQTECNSRATPVFDSYEESAW